MKDSIMRVQNEFTCSAERENLGTKCKEIKYQQKYVRQLVDKSSSPAVSKLLASRFLSKPPTLLRRHRHNPPQRPFALRGILVSVSNLRRFLSKKFRRSAQRDACQSKNLGSCAQPFLDSLDKISP